MRPVVAMMFIHAQFFVATGILVMVAPFANSENNSSSISNSTSSPTTEHLKVSVSTDASSLQNTTMTTLTSLGSTTKVENVPKTTSEKSSTTVVPPKKPTVVEDPHQLSVASVEQFLDNYFSNNVTNQTEAPSVSHLLQVLSLSTDQPTSTTTHQSIISIITEKKVKKTVSEGPAASPLSVEQNRISLGAGNIVGILIGVSVLVIGIAYIGLSYFPRAKRRSSYTEMFIQDPENDEEIALADYGDTHADIDTNF